MLANRPNREPDVQGANMRISQSKKRKPLGLPCVEYDLYFKRETAEEWVMPDDSTFDPPDWFLEGVDFVAWTNNRGNQMKPDYDWEYVEKASDYYKSKQTNFSKQVKKKILIHQLNDLKSKFDDLFELAMENINDQ